MIHPFYLNGGGFKKNATWELPSLPSAGSMARFHLLDENRHGQPRDQHYG
jgi:hypothetical protein